MGAKMRFIRMVTKMGVFDEWYSTSKEIVLDPDAFFSKLKGGVDKGKALMFAVINTIITMVLLGLNITLFSQGIAVNGMTFGAVAIMTGAGIILAIIGIAIISLIFDISLRIAGGHGDYSKAFAVFCYTTVFGMITNIFSLAMSITGFLGLLLFPLLFTFALYTYYAIIRGLIVVHDEMPIKVMGALGLTTTVLFIAFVVIMAIIMAVFMAAAGPMITDGLTTDLQTPMQAMAIAGLLE